MKNHNHYLDFFDYMERAPLTPEEIYGERHPFSSPSESVSNDKTLSFTDPGIDLNPSLPLDALNKLLTFYCYSPPHSVRPSDLYRALALESEKTLFHPAPPGELLFFVLLHYLDFVYDRHKDSIAAERLSKCITTLF